MSGFTLLPANKVEDLNMMYVLPSSLKSGADRMIQNVGRRLDGAHWRVISDIRDEVASQI
jgi:hypothetical protein